MAKRSIRKLRHLPVERAVERSPKFKATMTQRALVATRREDNRVGGAIRRAQKGGRDERKAAAVAKQKAMEGNP